MSFNKKYRYSGRNLLDEPENYFFSKYEGDDFILSYFISRTNVMRQIEEKGINLSDKEKRIEKYIDGIVNNEYIDTNNVLKDILKFVVNGDTRQKKYYLDRLLKKYEVTKKIYERYYNDFLNPQGTYRNMENYVLLSLCCTNYYNISDNLKYLNTAIKINDMLSSQQLDNISEDMLVALYLAIELEVECLRKLYIMEGVVYE